VAPADPPASGAAVAASGSALAAPDPDEADPWHKPGPKRDPLKRPLFWSITKDGKTTYVLGTMHIGIDAEARLPQIVWDKLDAAPTFAMETDLTDPAILGMGQRTGGSLRDDLGPVYWKKLEDILTPDVARGINGMKPMIAATLLSMRGLPMTPAMDGILLGRAINQKKQLVYLEPAKTQAALLEKWMDLRTLKMMIDSPDKGLTMAKQMLDAYVAGEEQTLLTLAESQKGDQIAAGFTEADYDRSMDDMLYRRNASWIEPIEKMHAQGNAFIAVGALHLVGKRSVFDLLAAKGYKITRITSTEPRGVQVVP